MRRHLLVLGLLLMLALGWLRSIVMTPWEEHLVWAVRRATGCSACEAINALELHAWDSEAAISYVRRSVVRNG